MRRSPDVQRYSKILPLWLLNIEKSLTRGHRFTLWLLNARINKNPFEEPGFKLIKRFSPAYIRPRSSRVKGENAGVITVDKGVISRDTPDEILINCTTDRNKSRRRRYKQSRVRSHGINARFDSR